MLADLMSAGGSLIDFKDPFKIFGKDEQVPDGSLILVPTGNADPDNFIDITGFEDILIALRVSNGGNYKIDAVMGSDVYSFANFSPINAAKRIEIAGRFDVSNVNDFINFIV